jgi:hypothetical protein
MPAPLEGPRIVSKLCVIRFPHIGLHSFDFPLALSLTLEHTSKVCQAAFPPGEHFSLHAGGPDVERVNRRGSFALAADRLAFM